jgi:DNA mismatch endonuclease Vsr
MTESKQWNVAAPPSSAWKPRAGRSPRAVPVEQDKAAGGRYRRFVKLDNGKFARASVALKVLNNTRRIRAYLRWSENGKSPTRYIGEVSQTTRSANLAEAWALAWGKGYLTEMPPPEDSWASSQAVRASMQGNRNRDTRPEVTLRKLLHKHGLRYRVNARPLAELRRTADVVFPRQKIAIFVDGCYWHGCPEHHRPSTKNSDFWQNKIQGNRERDQHTTRQLESEGWTVLRFWEHETPESAALRVLHTVRPT